MLTSLPYEDKVFLTAQRSVLAIKVCFSSNFGYILASETPVFSLHFQADSLTSEAQLDLPSASCCPSVFVSADQKNGFALSATSDNNIHSVPFNGKFAPQEAKHHEMPSDISSLHALPHTDYCACVLAFGGVCVVSAQLDWISPVVAKVQQKEKEQKRQSADEDEAKQQLHSAKHVWSVCEALPSSPESKFVVAVLRKPLNLDLFVIEVPSSAAAAKPKVSYVRTVGLEHFFEQQDKQQNTRTNLVEMSMHVVPGLTFSFRWEDGRWDLVSLPAAAAAPSAAAQSNAALQAMRGQPALIMTRKLSSRALLIRKDVMHAHPRSSMSSLFLSPTRLALLAWRAHSSSSAAAPAASAATHTLYFTVWDLVYGSLLHESVVCTVPASASEQPFELACTLLRLSSSSAQQQLVACATNKLFVIPLSEVAVLQKPQTLALTLGTLRNAAHWFDEQEADALCSPLPVPCQLVCCCSRFLSLLV